MKIWIKFNNWLCSLFKISNTDYALLIDGKWGSGKTYYVKNILIPLIEKDKKYKPIYISLNGLNERICYNEHNTFIKII